MSVLASSQIVACVCVVLWLSFPELSSQFQMGRSTKCAMLMRWSVAARHLHRAVNKRRGA